MGAAMNNLGGSIESRHERYTRVAVALHWAISAFVAFNLGTGYFLESMPFPFRITANMLHASSGVTVLALTVLRVVWRLLNPPPPHPAGMKPWERQASAVAHFLLYGAMVLMPLTGWAILSAHATPGSPGAAAEWAAGPPPVPGIKPGSGPPKGMPARPVGPPPPLHYWGMVPLPLIGPIEEVGREPGGLKPLRVLHDKFEHWHGVGSFLFIGLLILHVLGALKHQVIDKQPSLERMGVGRRTKP
jgi:cytochrome b561